MEAGNNYPKLMDSSAVNHSTEELYLEIKLIREQVMILKYYVIATK